MDIIENIKIGDILKVLGTLIVIVSTCEFFIFRIKKATQNVFDTKLKPINKRLNDIELSSDKNFIVRFLADIEQGNQIDEVERERFYEIYQRYKELGGNSYVSHKVEKLQKEGKL
jgi:hypothetical protein